MEGGGLRAGTTHNLTHKPNSSTSETTMPRQRPTTWKCLCALLLTQAASALVQVTPSTAAPGANPKSDFESGFDSHRMDALVQRGELEATLMQTALGPPLMEPLMSASEVVAETVPSKAGFGGGAKAGFGGGAKKKSKKKKVKTIPSVPVTPPLSTLSVSVSTLHKDGVVRLNNVLSSSTSAKLRKEVLERRDNAYAAIDGGENWRLHFADVLLKSNRCDLLLPLKGSRVVQTALRELLLDDGTRNDHDGNGNANGKLGSMLQSTIGDDATLYELAVLISEPGSPRQPVHPDNPYQENVPLLTCFVALQHVTSKMGPTTFLPNTHTAAAHAEFDNVATRDAMLEKRPNTNSLLDAGDASLFDSRTLHCGGANDSLEGGTRALLYVSFRNPRATHVGNVGSIMSDIKPITLRELKLKLAKLSDDTTLDPFEEEEAEAISMYRLAAAKGDADAMFNLGICYRRGEGVEKDVLASYRWFQLAANQGGAVAQCQLGFCYYLGEGVEKDEAEAVRWFELAAAQGLAHAQHNLGFCYSSGVGVARDLGKAALLFELAAEQGHPGAKVAYDQVIEEQTTLLLE
jgi:hypothetical protein